jgi:uncharacterized protein DUF3943
VRVKKRYLILIAIFGLTLEAVAQPGIDSEDLYYEDARDVPVLLGGAGGSSGSLLRGNPWVENYGADENGVYKWPGTYDLGTKDFLRDTAIAYGFQWAARMFYVRNKNSRIFRTSLSDWWDNISQWPEVDDGDEFFTNMITHPIVGAIDYLYYRSMGHSFWAAALGTVIQSTIFEYTIEGIVETPSLSDLIFTPLLGVPAGYVLEESSEWLVDTDFVPAKILAHIINPLRNFVDRRQIGIYNPLSKQFMSVSGPLTFNANSNEAIRLAYPFYMEPPLPIGRFMAEIDIVNMDRDLGGEFVFYSFRADVPSANDLWSIYVQVSQSGVNEITLGEEPLSDGFEFANLLVGGKHVMLKSRNSAIAAGMDLILPTAFKDNLDRLKTLLMYKRNFPVNLQNAWTITPYITGAVWEGMFSFQTMVSSDFVLNASKLEGNDFEYRFNYAATVGANFPIVLAPVLFAEFNGYTQPTADTFEETDLFVSGGFRFGRKFNPGFGVQVPIHGPDKEISKVGFIIDFQVRF